MKKIIFMIIISLWAACSMASTNEYQADVLRVVDGDTIVLRIHLGFDVTMDSHCRFYGVNAPEIHGVSYTNGMISRAFVSSMVSNRTIRLLTLDDKRDKYGRILGIIVVDGKNVNQLLLNKKLAVPMGDDGSAVKDFELFVEKGWWESLWR